jgi:hypothetical protein
MMKHTGLLLLVVCASAAVNLEFDGFMHFENWEGLINENLMQLSGELTNGNPIPRHILKDICAADTACDAFVSWGRFRSLMQNSSLSARLTLT